MVNEQSRDRYGRPLRGVLDAAFPGVPARRQISSAEAWSQASDYLATDLPFHAHEVFEQRWRCCPENERNAWQALAQWAAALTHVARGGSEGSKSLALRAKENLESCSYVPPEINTILVLESLNSLTRV
ncbi:MAG: DUF309 domain-containing protein [Actinobacteria bacterium]|uniref:Unannotated protein n=1 Tax=freshwater metagenome TaxID=449393 RepID=A0A6J7GY97_9ZZZZ|nr:DUF309 domain-containing protein [Actinomycetota bacterium]MTB27299.1 DUF309 domain-containing protein [Actinomycetota bacterium]